MQLPIIIVRFAPSDIYNVFDMSQETVFISPYMKRNCKDSEVLKLPIELETLYLITNYMCYVSSIYEGGVETYFQNLKSKNLESTELIKLLTASIFLELDDLASRVRLL